MSVWGFFGTMIGGVLLFLGITAVVVRLISGRKASVARGH